MANKEIIWTVKILGIVGAILSGISLIVPWGGYEFFGYGVNIYPWGTSFYSSSITEWYIFNIEPMTTNPIQTEVVVFGIFMILTFVFALIAFIIGLAGFRHIGIKSSNSFLIAGILAVIAMIMYIISISQITNYNYVAYDIGYGAGFFLLIAGFILYFIAFGIQKIMIPMPKTVYPQQPMYQQLTYQQSSYQEPHQQQPSQTPPPSQQQPAHQPPQQTQRQPKTPNFCPDCGTPVQPGFMFCDKCGHKFF